MWNCQEQHRSCGRWLRYVQLVLVVRRNRAGTGRDGTEGSFPRLAAAQSRRTDEIRALVGLEYAVPIRVRKGDIWK